MAQLETTACQYLRCHVGFSRRKGRIFKKKLNIQKEIVKNGA